jgi:hypothetical protein
MQAITSAAAAAAATTVPALYVLLAAFSWPPAEWSLPAHDDPRQTAYQQGVVYSLEYELQVQQVDVGPPSDSTPAEQLMQQVFAALNGNSWRSVASVVGPMQDAVQVSMHGQSPTPGLLSRLCQLLIIIIMQCTSCSSHCFWLPALVQHTALSRVLVAGIGATHCAVKSSVQCGLLLLQVTGLRSGRFYAARVVATATAAVEEGQQQFVFPATSSQVLPFRTRPTPPGQMQAPALAQRARNALKVSPQQQQQYQQQQQQLLRRCQTAGCQCLLDDYYCCICWICMYLYKCRCSVSLLVPEAVSCKQLISIHI